MAPKRSRPAPRRRAGLGDVISSPARDTRTSTETLPSFQADFIAARFGLDATRARAVAELCWGRT